VTTKVAAEHGSTIRTQRAAAQQGVTGFTPRIGLPSDSTAENRSGVAL